MSSPLRETEEEAASPKAAPQPGDPDFNVGEEEKKMWRSFLIMDDETNEEELMGSVANTSHAAEFTNIFDRISQDSQERDSPKQHGDRIYKPGNRQRG